MVRPRPCTNTSPGRLDARSQDPMRSKFPRYQALAAVAWIGSGQFGATDRSKATAAMDIKTLCLGVLSRCDATGYEIKKAFEEGPFGHIHAASFGAIYPALGALSDAGMVLGTEMAQEKRPDRRSMHS